MLLIMMEQRTGNLSCGVRFSKHLVYNVHNIKQLLTFLDYNVNDLPLFPLENNEKEDSGQIGIMVVVWKKRFSCPLLIRIYANVLFILYVFVNSQLFKIIIFDNSLDIMSFILKSKYF